MKVFLAMPYSKLCDEEYILKPKYKKFCEKLIEGFENIKIEYFLAHKRENWGKNYCSDKESTLIDFNTIKNSDLICIIPGIPHSGGVHVEIGWASANQKEINMFLQENQTYSPMVTGINIITKTNFFYYQDEYSDDLIEMIINSVKEYKNKLER